MNKLPQPNEIEIKLFYTILFSTVERVLIISILQFLSATIKPENAPNLVSVIIFLEFYFQLGELFAHFLRGLTGYF